jgi:hypothetical protein
MNAHSFISSAISLSRKMHLMEKNLSFPVPAYSPNEGPAALHTS